MDFDRAALLDFEHVDFEDIILSIVLLVEEFITSEAPAFQHHGQLALVKHLTI